MAGAGSRLGPTMDTTRGPGPASLPLLPAASFVLVWCSGYIAGPAAVEAVSPFWALAVRFVVAAVVTVGMGATLAALLHSLSPVLTAVLAGVVLSERLTRLQVLGFVLGVAGVLVVLGPDVSEAGGAVGIGFGVASLVALSLGTLGQRWYHLGDPDAADRPDPLWAAAVQFAVCVPPLLVLAALLEGAPTVADPTAAAVSVLWLALVNSLAGLLLLALLVRRGGAGASASDFFVCPPVTALLAWMFFGSTLDVREMLGILVAVVGVAIATGVGGRPQRPAAAQREVIGDRAA